MVIDLLILIFLSHLFGPLIQQVVAIHGNNNAADIATIKQLVYEPILDPSQGIEYCQSNIDLKFGTYDEKTDRDTQRHGILNPVGRIGSQNLFREALYSKRLMRENCDDFALRERLLIQYGDKYYPVKKYAIDLSETYI